MELILIFIIIFSLWGWRIYSYQKNNGVRKDDAVYYYQHKKLHREDGPAVIIYNENGDIKTLNYYINGELSEGNIFN